MTSFPGSGLPDASGLQRLRWITLALPLLLGGACLAQDGTPQPPLTVSSDFPGGSVQIESIDQTQRAIHALPAHHQDRGWTCWWYFQVDGIAPGEALTLDMGGGVWATPNQAFYSMDRKHWIQLSPGKRSGKDRIVYQQKIDSSTAWFAWGPPFLPDDAVALVKSAVAACPAATEFELCKTRAGRSTPALRIREPGLPDKDRSGIWIQARQHAWETGSSWVCAGLVHWLISDAPEAVKLRRSADIVIVPIMDIDNVTIGAGGKNEVPQDHNRDWTDHPHWRAVEAAQHGILEMDEQVGFDLFIDLHNPSAGDRAPYFYVPPGELLKEEGKLALQRFVETAKQEMTGLLAYQGKVLESGRSYDPNWAAISKNWVMQKCRPGVVSVTLETAWNTPESHQAGYEHVGAGLGRTISRLYSQDAPTAP